MVREQRVHEQFLLMLNLSQITDSDEVIRLFMEALSEFYPAYRFETTPAECLPPDYWAVPIATIRRRFGSLVVIRKDAPSSTPNGERPSLEGELRNLTGMLAVILENRAQTRELEALNHRLEEAAAQSRDILAHMTRVLPVYLYTYNMEEHRITYVSSDRFGFSRVVDEDRARVQAHFDDMAEIEESAEIEYRMRFGDSETRWFLSIHAPYVRRDSRTLLIVGAAIDITDRKAILDQKDILLREVNHRVKNNLAVISGLLHLQARRVDDPSAAKAFEDSRRRLDAMALIHEHLYEQDDVSELRIGEYLSQLVEHIVEAAGRPEVAVVSDCAQGVGDVELDEAIACGLIVNELVTNALEHGFADGRSGSIQVTVSAGESGGIGGLVVSDSGNGAESVDALIDAPSLGLKLVQQLSRQLGLVPVFETSSGEGTTVSLEADSSSCGTPLSCVDTRRVARVEGDRPPRIFVIEDEEILVLSLQQWAADRGVEVVGHAPSGELAVAAIAELPTAPDAVVTGILLKGETNGIEAARRIQDNVDTHFVFQSGLPQHDLIAEIAAADISSYTVVSKQRLRRELERILSL